MNSAANLPLAKIMGTEHIYVPDESILPDFITLVGTNWHVESMNDFMKQQPREDFRIILERSLAGQPHVGILYLYWFISVNLQQVDEEASNQPIAEIDTDNAVVCNYHATKCLDGCGRIWHTFVLDKYFLTEPPDQNINKIHQLKVLSCPSCQTRFRLPVVKIFGEASP